MPILRMKAPEGLMNFTHEGHPAEIEDGVVQIDHRHAGDYMQHGFTLVDEPHRPMLAPAPKPNSAAASMQQTNPAVLALLDKLMTADTSTLARLSAVLNEEPGTVADASPLPPQQADLAVIHAADPRPATDPGPIPSDGPLTEDQIDRMTPAQMKAWLKARDVPMVGIGSDVDVLRLKVRHANQG